MFRVQKTIVKRPKEIKPNLVQKKQGERERTAIQREVQKEIAEWTDMLDGRDPNYLDLYELNLTDRCITECMRLWTVVPFGTFRQLMFPDTVTGPGGEEVLLPKDANMKSQLRYFQYSSLPRRQRCRSWALASGKNTEIARTNHLISRLIIMCMWVSPGQGSIKPRRV